MDDYCDSPTHIDNLLDEGSCHNCGAASRWAADDVIEIVFPAEAWDKVA